MERTRAPLTPGQSDALQRARVLAAELAAELEAVRAELADARATGDDSTLAAGELRVAFSAARRSARTGSRPRWADDLLSGR